jgi:hypothetical protein
MQTSTITSLPPILPTLPSQLSFIFTMTVQVPSDGATEAPVSNGTESNGVKTVIADTNGTETNNTDSTDTTDTKTNGTDSTDTKTDDTDATSKPTYAPEGSLVSSRSVYRGPADDEGVWTWLDKEPENVPEAAENEDTAQYAIITRLKQANDSRKKFELDSIVIQSPQLKEALSEVFRNYPGIHCELRRLVFDAPFGPFVHRWDQFLEFRARKDLDKVTAEHIELLYNVMKAELKDVLATMEDYVQHGVITFEHVWSIFQPGTTIYSSSHNGSHGAFTLASGSYVETRCGKVYQLALEVIDWNGDDFGRGTEYINLRQFVGTTRIVGLAAFPLSFHPTPDRVKEALISRGKKFEALAGSHYKQYDGFAVVWDKDDRETPIMCKGRIIVDAKSFERFSDQYIPYISTLDYTDGAEASEYKPRELNADFSNGGGYIPDKSEDDERIRLTDELLLICVPRVRGYSLKKKQWMLFYIDRVTDIDFNTNAFESLVLPEDQKELILSFAESQTMHTTTFDDIISGKGRGHITLLSGPPGVGKTLTAESVSEHMRAPLFMMSSGDLGTNPEQVEEKLSEILEMIAKWNAVLLIDECDVFLEARSNNDLERNKLVSIFLRILEYYEGLLFLTTNRIDNIDAAFQSRIHISLAYPDLTVASRRHIWDNFLTGLKVRQDWSETDLDELATVELNGRQIKNVLKSAALLSARKNSALEKKYVDVVLAIERRRPGVARG